MEEIKASIDVGDGISTLLTKLAENIGTSVDQVFPWYVNQAVIDGWVFLAIASIIILLLLIMVGYSYKRADFDNENVFAFVFIISTIVTFIAMIACTIGVSGSVSKILNPEYHAVRELIKDVARLKF